MDVRRLTRDDARAARDIYMAIVNAGALDYWPQRINRAQTVEHVRKEIAAGRAHALGGFKPDDVLRGFLLIRREQITLRLTTPPMPEDTYLRPAWRLWLWGMEMGLANQQYKQLLDALYAGWFSRVQGLCWGVGPYDLMPRRVCTYADNRFDCYDYEENGVRWRIWVHEA